MTGLETFLVTIFWACVACVIYAYVGYPIVVSLLARVFGRAVVRPPEPDHWPTVSLLIAAHNEESVIAARLDNALALDYPREQIEIIVASDGSTDATPQIVERYAERGVTLKRYEPRRGKATVLNATVSGLRGAIVVLSDANTFLERDALRKLAPWFNDPAVGMVCGRLILTDPVNGGNVDSLYWRYETHLKQAENRLGALLGANGAIYALRKDVYRPIPNETLVDDFVIPLLSKLRTGCRLVYDPDAVAIEETPADIGDEFHRRSRIGAGGFQSLPLLWPLLHPRWGWLAFSLFSHKIVRWLTPIALAVALITNALLLHLPLYRATFAAQCLLYAISVCGNLIVGRGAVARTVRLVTLFVATNLALLVGLTRWLTSRQQGTWQRTAR